MIFKRYSELNSEQMDLHIHTNWTDGKNSLEEMIFTASELNLQQIAFTDHIRMDSSYFGDYVSAIETIKDKYKMDIFVGYEAKIKNYQGDIDVSEDVVNQADVRIASVHRFPTEDGLRGADSYIKEEAQTIEKELSVNAIKHNKGFFNVLGHCGGMSISKFGEFPKNYLEEIIKLCADCDVAFEVNYRYHNGYIELLDELLKQYNPFVTFGSDAHDQAGMRIRRRIKFETKK